MFHKGDQRSADESAAVPEARVDLVVADVDGTLVTSDKQLTEGTRRVVERLRKTGIGFAVTSGRPPRGLASLIASLQIELPVAAFNGGLFVAPDLRVLEQRTLSREIAVRAVSVIAKQGLDVWVYQGAQWYVRDRHAPHVDREATTVAFEPEVVVDFEGRLDGVVKVVGVSDDHEAVSRTEVSVREACGSDASVSRSQPYYVDVTHPRANKGEVVAWMARYTGVPAERIATIGDGPNDVFMFRRSGFSIAMGNAGPAVQKAARWVTLSNDEEGFARALEAHVLGPA